MLHWLRRKILSIRYVYVEKDNVVRAELRCFGVKIGRATYCTIGRWLGRKKNDVTMRRF